MCWLGMGRATTARLFLSSTEAVFLDHHDSRWAQATHPRNSKRQEKREERPPPQELLGDSEEAPAYSLALSKLITSSDVITPVNFRLSSTTGSVSRLYLSNSSANCNSLASAWIKIRGSCVSASM